MSNNCGVAASVVEQHRYPNVRPLEIDDDLLGDRDYRKIEGAFAIHSAPGSDESEELGDGFTYLTVEAQQGEWSKVGENEWGALGPA